jgi:hypothetical protein
MGPPPKGGGLFQLYLRPQALDIVDNMAAGGTLLFTVVR